MDWQLRVCVREFALQHLSELLVLLWRGEFNLFDSADRLPNLHQVIERVPVSGGLRVVPAPIPLLPDGSIQLAPKRLFDLRTLEDTIRVIADAGHRESKVPRKEQVSRVHADIDTLCHDDSGARTFEPTFSGFNRGYIDGATLLRQ